MQKYIIIYYKSNLYERLRWKEFFVLWRDMMKRYIEMLRNVLIMWLIFITSFGSSIQVAAADYQRVAKVSELSGEVGVLRAGGEKSISAFKGMGLNQGDTIITKKDSWVRVILDNDKEVKIGPSTKIMVKELKGSAVAESTELQLWTGNVFNHVQKKLNANSKYEIHTPTAVMGVRGTEYFAKQSQEGTEVTVIEGTVEVTSADQSSSTEVNSLQRLTIFGDTGIQNLESINLDELDLFTLQTLLELLERYPGVIDIDKDEVENLIQKKQEEEKQSENEEQEPPRVITEGNNSSATGGSSSSGGGSPSTSRVRKIVYVKDENGNAIEGAKVTLINANEGSGAAIERTTGSNGEAIFEVTPGSYIVEVSKEGYEGRNVEVTINAGENPLTEIILTQNDFEAELLPMNVESTTAVVRFNSSLHENILNTDIDEIISDIEIKDSMGGYQSIKDLIREVRWSSMYDGNYTILILTFKDDLYALDDKKVLRIAFTDQVKDKNNTVLKDRNIEAPFVEDYFARVDADNNELLFKKAIKDYGIQIDIALDPSGYYEYQWADDITQNADKIKKLINGFFAYTDQDAWKKVQEAMFKKIDSGLSDVVALTEIYGEEMLVLKFPAVPDYDISQIQKVELIIPKEALKNSDSDLLALSNLVIDDYNALITHGLNPNHDLDTPAWIITDGLDMDASFSDSWAYNIKLEFSVYDEEVGKTVYYRTGALADDFSADMIERPEITHIIRNLSNNEGGVLSDQVSVHTVNVGNREELILITEGRGADAKLEFAIVGLDECNEGERSDIQAAVETAFGMINGQTSFGGNISDYEADLKVGFKVNNEKYYIQESLKELFNGDAEDIWVAIGDARNEDNLLSELAVVSKFDNDETVIAIVVGPNDTIEFFVEFSSIPQPLARVLADIIGEAFGLEASVEFDE